MDQDQKQKEQQKKDTTAHAEQEINEYFYKDDRENNDNLIELTNRGLASIYMEKPEKKM